MRPNHTGVASKAAIMTRYTIPVAVLCGAALASASVLLINLSLPSPVAVLLGLLKLPCGILTHLVVRSDDFGPPLLVLAGNILFYSLIAYAGFSVLGRGISPEKMGIAAAGLVLPAVILIVLVCIPAFNPLWPRGMAELARQEKSLQEAFPIGMGLDVARAALRSKGVQFYENTEEKQGIVLDNGKGETLTASPGDGVISARFETGASRYPCWYDMQIVLLFGRDDKLKQQYVHRLRVCP
jgi:hypothetical protein